MKKIKRLSLIVITIACFTNYSCKNNNENFISTTNGIWESCGSGWILDIKDSTEYALYDINKVACLPFRTGSYVELASNLNLKSDTLSLFEGITTYQFKRIETLPPSCALSPDFEKSKSPLYNFDYFAETVNEHYAFLDLNNIQWDKLYKEQRSKLNEASSEAELYLIIEETLEKLNDNHAFLEAPDEVYDAIDLIEQKEDEESESDLPWLGDLPVAKEVSIHHLEKEMTKDSWLIQWGKMTDKIGYIQIKSMWLYAEIELPQDLVDSIGFVDAFIETRHKMYEGDYIRMEVEGVRKIMKNAMKDLESSNAIVIDMRFNGGGQDAVSNEILRHFSDKKRQVWKQYFRHGNAFTSLDKIFVDKSENAFTKPVYVLTSRKTGSAAECFSLATMSMDHIKRIGDNTQGAMSTTLDKTLPNGWPFSISNQILMDNEGTQYENKGVPADFAIDYPDDIQSFFRSVLNDLDKDKRDILNAIKEIEENNQ